MIPDYDEVYLSKDLCYFIKDDRLHIEFDGYRVGILSDDEMDVEIASLKAAVEFLTKYRNTRKST